MPTRIAINGEIGDETSARITVLDRGFLYGDSVYEVLRSYGGHLYALDEHLERLWRSAAILEFSLPWTKALLRAEIEATASAAREAREVDVYVRAIVTRGGGPIGLDPMLAVAPNRVVIVTPLVPLAARLYEEGVKICLVPVGRAASGVFPFGAKSSNYLTNILALRAARQQEAHEAVMVDTEGRVTEGSTSNVFMVSGGAVCTPTAGSGILQGITRGKVLGIGRALGLPMREIDLRPDDLRRADEVFITSSLREVLPVVRVDDETIGDGQPGPITRHLHAALRRAIAEETVNPCRG